MAIIRGQVGENGGRAVGAGFSAERTQEGNYTVTFDKPFGDTPIIVATSVKDAGGYRSVSLYDVSTRAFSATTRKDGNRKDASFNFYASNDYNA